MSFAVRAIQFGTDGVHFDFVEVPDDLRSNGMLMNRALFVPERAMPDELQALMEKAISVVGQAMYLHQKSIPVTAEEMDQLMHGEIDPDLDGPSPWDNPVEREVPAPEEVFKKDGDGGGDSTPVGQG